jgi:hypothetical protein
VADAAITPNELIRSNDIKANGILGSVIGNVPYVQSVLTTPGYLGIMMYQFRPGRTASFSASEGPYAPMLELWYYPAVPGDFNLDRDVDLDDCTAFGLCFTGANVGTLSPSCTGVDFDHDGDVDMEDFGLFQRCFSGTGVPGRPNCLD